MSDKYHGMVDDKRYSSDEIDVTFNGKRCIHAAECVSRLEAVFDTGKRPWIQPWQESADAIAATIQLCPSGALHYVRKDGGANEPISAENIIYLVEGAYLRIQGDLEIDSGAADITNETRAALCRCGASSNKPFCDNSHRDVAWETGSPALKSRKDDLATGGKLRINVSENGPIGVSGNFEIRDEAGETVFQAENRTAWLCRCGGSNAKPFCDGTHKKINFQAA
jgi:CDGSH-type Zn-finger protein/uncharacterized Fe-S cluster protein YjdI